MQRYRWCNEEHYRGSGKYLFIELTMFVIYSFLGNIFSWCDLKFWIGTPLLRRQIFKSVGFDISISHRFFYLCLINRNGSMFLRYKNICIPNSISMRRIQNLLRVFVKSCFFPTNGINFTSKVCTKGTEVRAINWTVNWIKVWWGILYIWYPIHLVHLKYMSSHFLWTHRISLKFQL